MHFRHLSPAKKNLFTISFILYLLLILLNNYISFLILFNTENKRGPTKGVLLKENVSLFLNHLFVH